MSFHRRTLNLIPVRNFSFYKIPIFPWLIILSFFPASLLWACWISSCLIYLMSHIFKRCISVSDWTGNGEETKYLTTHWHFWFAQICWHSFFLCSFLSIKLSETQARNHLQAEALTATRRRTWSRTWRDHTERNTTNRRKSEEKTAEILLKLCRISRTHSSTSAFCSFLLLLLLSLPLRWCFTLKPLTTLLSFSLCFPLSFPSHRSLLLLSFLPRPHGPRCLARRLRRQTDNLPSLLSA